MFSVYTPCVITFILEISEPGYLCIYRFPYAILIILCIISSYCKTIKNCNIALFIRIKA